MPRGYGIAMLSTGCPVTEAIRSKSLSQATRWAQPAQRSTGSALWRSSSSYRC